MKLFSPISLAIYLIFAKCNEDDFNYVNYDDTQEDNKLTITNNFYVNSISYELSYNEFSIIKVTIKLYDEIDNDINFSAFLKSDNNNEYILNCSNKYYETIECLSQNNITFDTQNYYYFYYKKENNMKYKFNGKDIFEDNKRISLVFKPEVLGEQILYKDKRKLIVKNHGKMVGGGYLYLTKKPRKVLQKPKDGFNKYIELNNFIPHCGLMGYRPQSTFIAYKEAIRRGYHIVDADLLFSKDKVPVICHGKKLNKVSNGKGEIPSKTFKELKKLDFGSVFNKKYKGAKILTFEKLLKLCKEKNIIIDLDLCHCTNEYFNNTNKYIKIIIDLIEKYDMLNSIFFNERRLEVISKFNKYKKGLSFSIQNMNEKKNIEEIKDKFKETKRIIYNMVGGSDRNNINKDALNYSLSLGKKIKAAIVDDLDYANEITSYGVNYMTTNYLHPFMIKNDKEEPIIVRCFPSDDNNDISKCEIKEDIKLKDNQIYNIYYSDNIYNISEDINDEPIGEFKYLDTNKLEEVYYNPIIIDFIKGVIKINTSNKVKKGEKIMGVIGPSYDDVAECYQYNFVCNGNNSKTLECTILKGEVGKVKYNGNYSIYSLEDYSFNPYKINLLDKTKYAFYLLVFAFVLIVFSIMCTMIKSRKRNKSNKKEVSEKTYISFINLYK